MKNSLFTLLFLSNSVLLFGQSLIPTGNLNQIRYKHESKLLNNGTVLTFGGSDAVSPSTSIYYSSSELYDPTSGTWSTSASMNAIRETFASVILPNGNILAIGGKNQFATPTASCEIYDVATDSWSYTDSMEFARYGHDVVILNDGRILVAGGDTFGNRVEIYDPSTSLWTTVSNSIGFHNQYMSLTILNDGKVLLTGGWGALPTSNVAEIYNPQTDTWTSLPDMNQGRYSHKSILLNNGKVLIYSGDGAFIETAELYDPATNTFTITGDPQLDRSWCNPVKLSDGRILVYGHGDFFSPGNSKVIELYDPTTGLWSSPAYSVLGASAYSMVALQTGQILIIGGNIQTGGGAFNLCWLIGGVTAAGINEISEENNYFKLYPNPTEKILNVKFKSNIDKNKLTIKITDLSGKSIELKPNTNLLNDTFSFDVEKLDIGIYYCTVIDNEQSYVKSFIVK